MKNLPRFALIGLILENFLGQILTNCFSSDNISYTDKVRSSYVIMEVFVWALPRTSGGITGPDRRNFRFVHQRRLRSPFSHVMLAGDTRLSEIEKFAPDFNIRPSNFNSHYRAALPHKSTCEMERIADTAFDVLFEEFVSTPMNSVAFL